MTKLQKGKLYISKEDIIKTLGLTEDTVISSVTDGGDGIEINIIASGENKQDWLVDSTNNNWNMRRKKLNVSEEIEEEIVFGSKGITIKSNGVTILHSSENVPNEKDREKLNNISLIIQNNVSSKEESEKFVETIKKHLKNSALKGMQ